MRFATILPNAEKLDPSSVTGPPAKIGTNDSTPAFTVQDLFALDNTIRTKFLSLLCNATYDDVDTELAASYFIEKCLELCGGSKVLLSQTLQTKFVDRRTPLFWVVCHIKWTENIPPIIRQLLDHCGSVVPSTVSDDLALACCNRGNKHIYELLRQQHHVGSDTTPLATAAWKGGDWPKTIWVFKFPQFLDQMLIAGVVSVTWLSYWSVYNLTFSTTPGDEWIMRVECVRSRPWNKVVEPQSFELNVHKLRLYADSKHEKWDTNTEKRTGKFSQLCSKDGLKVDFLRQRTDFCDKTRALAITLSHCELKYI